MIVRSALFAFASLALVACSEGERPVRTVMQLPLTTSRVELGARAMPLGPADLPVAILEIDLPTSYQLRRGGPDDSLSTHTFDAHDAFVPSFSIRRPVGGATEELGEEFGSGPDVVVTRGVHGATSWAMEVHPTPVATRTIVETLQETPRGTVFCSGYVDTTDSTPVGDWMVERCSSLRLSAE